MSVNAKKNCYSLNRRLLPLIHEISLMILDLFEKLLVFRFFNELSNRFWFACNSKNSKCKIYIQSTNIKPKIIKLIVGYSFQNCNKNVNILRMKLLSLMLYLFLSLSWYIRIRLCNKTQLKCGSVFVMSVWPTSFDLTIFKKQTIQLRVENWCDGCCQYAKFNLAVW